MDFRSYQIINLDDHKLIQFIKKINTHEYWTIKDYDSSFEYSLNKCFYRLFSTNTNYLTSHSKEITELVFYLPMRDFLIISHYIDYHHPSVSFHYVIEAKHATYNTAFFNSDYLLIYRFIELMKSHLLTAILSPMRTRLISGLLDDCTTPLPHYSTHFPRINNLSITELQDKLDNSFLDYLEYLKN